MFAIKLIVAAAAVLTAGLASAQTFNTTTPLPATVPDSPGSPSLCGTPGAPLNLSIPVTGVTGTITGISVSLGIATNWVGESAATLIAPGGAVTFSLYGRIGATTAGGTGDSSNFGGVYQFVDPSVSAQNIWSVAQPLDTNGVVPPGAYATTQPGGAGVTAPAPTTPFLATFAGLTPAQVNGNWTLRLEDYCNADVATVSSATLTLAAAPVPTPVPTEGEWGQVFMGLAAAGLGARRLRLRQGAT